MFKITEINASKTPVLYTLTDLMNEKLTGFYYAKQLTKASKPNYKKDYFFVERVLREEIINGEKYFEVKFLYYPNKFNLLVPEQDIKKSSLF